MVSEEKSFESVDGRRMDDGGFPYYKLPRSLRLRGAKKKFFWLGGGGGGGGGGRVIGQTDKQAQTNLPLQLLRSWGHNNALMYQL